MIFLYGIESDRQACDEIQFNLAYRWFCKLAIEDNTPDHSSLTKIRDRLGVETFKNVFEKIVNICIEKNLANGKKIMMDGSIIKADAALKSMVDRPQEGEKLKDIVPPKYIKDRKLGNKTQISKTDPDSTLAGKAGEPKKLAFKVHETIDCENRIIIDAHVTTGSAVEGHVMLGRIDYIEKAFDLKVEEITADRGYGFGVNLQALQDREINSFVPRFQSDNGDRITRDSAGFAFDKNKDCFICPERIGSSKATFDHSMKYEFISRGLISPVLV
ncbi:MAG: transposase [Bdellovibrio sp.]|nr:transposase [Bdellovibrio sp.]